MFACKRCPLCVLGVVVFAGSLVALGVGAGRDPDKKGGMAPIAGQPAGDSDPNRQKDMEAMMKGGELGPEHELLKQFEGVWSAKAVFFMDPGAPPMESQGTMTNTLELGGRVLRQRFEGDMGPMGPFSGMGDFGFDNLRGQWWATWMDSMATGCMMYTGSYDAASKTWTTAAMYSIPGIPGQMSMRNTLTIDSPDQSTFTIYETMPGKPESKMGQIVYTRQAGKPINIKIQTR